MSSVPCRLELNPLSDEGEEPAAGSSGLRIGSVSSPRRLVRPLSTWLSAGGGAAGVAVVGTTGTEVVSSGKGFEFEEGVAGFCVFPAGCGASPGGLLCDDPDAGGVGVDSARSIDEVDRQPARISPI